MGLYSKPKPKRKLYKVLVGANRIGKAYHEVARGNLDGIPWKVAEHEGLTQVSFTGGPNARTKNQLGVYGFKYSPELVAWVKPLSEDSTVLGLQALGISPERHAKALAQLREALGPTFKGQVHYIRRGN